MLELSRVPSDLASALSGSRIDRKPEARLGTQLYHIVHPSGAHRYLKVAAAGSVEDLDVERARLEWLSGRLPVPEVAGWWRNDEASYLLITELPGRTGSDEFWRDDVPALIGQIVEGMGTIHALDITGCPFVGTLAEELAEAERRIANGTLNLPEFLEDSGGRSPEDIYRELRDRQGEIRETVFTHGDYCLPNVLLRDWRIAGFIDWGNGGVADPNRDLMAMADSIAFNCGEQWRQPFFDAVDPAIVDHDTIRYYTLLDYFFGHHMPDAAAGDEQS